MCNIIIREINDSEKKGYRTGKEENDEQGEWTRRNQRN